jgi:hypothetical protein
VKPETVIAWQRQGFRLFWTWKSRRRIGRRAVAADVRALIRSMSATNPLWGAPRIHGELLKLGLDVFSSDRREEHAPAQQAAVADVAHVHDESRPANCGGRFLRCADGNAPTLVRAADPRA